MKVLTNKYSMEDKVVLVSGGASGIGEATVRTIVGNGGKVVVLDVQAAKGEKLAAELGQNVVFIHGDVTSEADWALATETAEKTFGKLNGLVTCAGNPSHGKFMEFVTVEEFSTLVDIHLGGTFRGIKAVIEPMRRAGGGSIVTFASVGGHKGEPTSVSYCCAKWGTRGLTRLASAELAADNIRVNCVAPGVTDTPMIWETKEQTLNAIQGKPGLAQKRIADPLEQASVVAFLLSDDSSFMTAQDVCVEGGYLNA